MRTLPEQNYYLLDMQVSLYIDLKLGLEVEK